MQLDLYDGDEYLSLSEVRDRLREFEERRMLIEWSPAGRRRLLQRMAGTELRHFVALGGREIEDVPLPS